MITVDDLLSGIGSFFGVVLGVAWYFVLLVAAIRYIF